MRLAANLSLMFTELPFLERFGAAARAGFAGCEFLFPYDYAPDRLNIVLRDSGLSPVLFNVYPGDWDNGERGLCALQGRESEFEEAIAQAISYARTLGCRQLHAMAGLEAQGADRSTYIANLRRASTLAAAHGITILIEPINTDDMPGYFLNRTETAVEIIREVETENLRLQFDLYHRHKMQGGVLEAIAAYANLTAHYQCAAPRDRGEPDRQDLDYQTVFQAIAATGFDGWIGCEYRPRGLTEDGLGWRQTILV